MREPEQAVIYRSDFPVGHSLVRHRSRRSVEVIHRASCPYVKQIKDPTPWEWAEGRPVTEWLSLGWFRPCFHCAPHMHDEEKR